MELIAIISRLLSPFVWRQNLGKAIIAIFLVLISVPTYAVVTTPTLSSPAAGVTAYVGTTVNFTWSAVSGATGYELEFDAGQTYAYTATTTTASLSWSIVAGGLGAHTWQVRAKSGTTYSAWTTARSYTVAFNPITLASPASGATLYAGSTVVFSWSAPSGATAYDVEFDSGQAYAFTTSPTAAALNWLISTSTGSHTWRVRAKAGTSIGAWTSTQSYTSAYFMPSPNSPANGTTEYVGTSFTFNWTSATGVTGYDFEYDTGTSYAATVSTTTNTLAATASAAGIGSHTWHVRAKFGTVIGPWSAIANYLIAEQVPTLSAPANNSTQYVGNSFSFGWTAVTGAIGYEVQFDVGTSYASTNTTSNNTLPWTFGAGSVGAHTWRVRTKTGSTYGSYSGTFNYVVAFPFITLSTPASGTIFNIGDATNFNWSNSTGADSYEIQFDTGTTYQSTSTSTTPSFKTTAALGGLGTHTWQVRAKYGTNYGLWSTSSAYTVSSPVIGLQFPASGFNAYVGTVLGFGWSEVSGQSGYEVEFDAGTSYVSQTTSLTNTLDWPLVSGGVGSHTWHVRAKYGAAAGPWSNTWTYTVATQPHIVRPAVNPVIKGYFQYSMNDVKQALSIQYDKLTDIFFKVDMDSYGSIHPDGNGNIVNRSNQMFNVVNSQCIAHGTNLYLSIGTDKNNIIFPRITGKIDSLKNFAAQCASFCANNSLAGIDIDWEFPTVGQASQFKNLLAWIRTDLNNQTQLTGKTYKLSIAAPDYNAGNGITVDAIQYLDYLNVMAYDDKPLNAGNNYNHSSFDFMKKLMDNWAAQGVPYNKMVVGVPFYGRNQTNWDDGVGFVGFTDNSSIAYESDTFTSKKDGKTFGYNGITTLLKKMDYVKSKGCAGVFIWQLTHDAECPNSLLTAMSLPDPNEPNDDIGSATATFASPLNQTAASKIVTGAVQSGSDQDWFKIPVDGKGTLKLDLSSLPANYDLELYPINGLSGNALKGSYNTGTTAESITYVYNTAASTILYAKVYPKDNTQYDPCNKYSFLLTWTPGAATTCTSPAAPVATFGSDACGSPLSVSGTTASLAFTGKGNSFQGAVSKYPYGTPNIVYSAPCQSTTTAFQVIGLIPGMIYRWNMSSYGGTDCASCQSPISNTKYFSLPPAITSATTQLTAGGTITMSTAAQNPGTVASVSYHWLKDGQLFQQGSSLTSVTLSAPGTYTLVNDYSGSTDCSGTTSTSTSNAIVITAATGTGCSASTAATAINQAVVGNTGSGPTVQLSVTGGSLGTNALWHWYRSSCGGTAIGTGVSITINPTATDDYFVRAEGDCGTTTCAQTTVSFSAGCTYATDPASLTASVNNINPGTAVALTVNGGSLGTNGSWYFTTGSCGGTPAGTTRGGVLNVNPTVTTTYYVQAVSSCNTTECAQVTVNVLNKPTIAAFSPLSAPGGTPVTITGTNFSGATAVSFGGTAASSFTVNSATSITAIVGSGTSGDVSVSTPGGATTMNGFNYVFSLPVTNFAVAMTSASCKGSNNGSIGITATQALSYTAAVTGPGTSANYTFTINKTITGLAPGTYNICISVAGQTYQQCFTAVVTEPKDLALYAAHIDPVNKTADLLLTGGDTYHISLNGATPISTSQSNVRLNLQAGNNRIILTSDKPCQVPKDTLINLSANPIPYPIPFEGTLNVNLGQDPVKLTTIAIYSAANGAKVFAATYINRSGVLTLDLSKLNSGVYEFWLTRDGQTTNAKISKP